MKRSRPLLLAGTLLPTVVVGGVGYWLVARSSPDAAFSRLWLDVGLAVFLGAVVSVLTQGPGQLVQRLADTLRGISIGQRDRRLEPEKFGDLADVARACNEIAAALTEHDDPNLGEVQRRRRTADEAAQKAELDESLSSGDQPQLAAALSDGAAARDWRAQQIAELSEHPDVGPVRKRKRADDDEEASDGEGGDEAPAAAGQPPIGPADAPPPADEQAPNEALADGEAPSSPPRAAEESGSAADSPALHEAPTITPADGSARTEVGDADPALDTNVDASVLNDAAEDAAAGATVPDTPAVDLPEPAADRGDDRPYDEPSDQPPSAPSEEGRADEAAEDEDDAADDEADDEAAPEAAAAEEDEPDEDADQPDEDQPDEDQPDEDQADPLEALFDAYVSAKKEQGESTDDLELTSFVETIRDESERLRENHQCRDVRFEVRVQDGAVSLLPRLLR